MTDWYNVSVGVANTVFSRQINSSTLPSVRRQHLTLLGTTTFIREHNTFTPSDFRHLLELLSISTLGRRISRSTFLKLDEQSVTTCCVSRIPSYARVGAHPGHITPRVVSSGQYVVSSPPAPGYNVLGVATLRVRCGWRRSIRIRLLRPFHA